MPFIVVMDDSKITILNFSYTAPGEKEKNIITFKYICGQNES